MEDRTLKELRDQLSSAKIDYIDTESEIKTIKEGASWLCGVSQYEQQVLREKETELRALIIRMNNLTYQIAQRSRLINTSLSELLTELDSIFIVEFLNKAVFSYCHCHQEMIPTTVKILLDKMRIEINRKGKKTMKRQNRG